MIIGSLWLISGQTSNHHGSRPYSTISRAMRSTEGQFQIFIDSSWSLAKAFHSIIDRFNLGFIAVSILSEYLSVIYESNHSSEKASDWFADLHCKSLRQLFRQANSWLMISLGHFFRSRHSNRSHLGISATATGVGHLWHPNANTETDWTVAHLATGRISHCKTWMRQDRRISFVRLMQI